MAGVKGRSGRKTKTAEQSRLADVERCWKVMMQFINSDAPLKERSEMASKIAVKAIPDVIEHTGDLIINYGYRSKKPN
jgi:hypothetical protein